MVMVCGIIAVVNILFVRRFNMSTKTKDCFLFLGGVTICFAIAAVAVILEELIPGGILGASIIALFMGTIINSF